MGGLPSRQVAVATNDPYLGGMTELELKLLVRKRDTRKLRARLKDLAGLKALPGPSRLRSIYFDTPDFALKNAGIALRLRHDGRTWVQTVKSGRIGHSGLQSVQEFNCDAPNGRLNLSDIPETAIPKAVLATAPETHLKPICESRMQRTVVVMSWDKSASIEVAIDVGEIRAGTRRAPFRELELELLSGAPGALFDLAAALYPKGGLRLSHHSKAKRGFLLATTNRIAPPLPPRKARAVAISPGQSADIAARDALRECFDQIVGNLDMVMLSDAPEGIHQFRVGLRRLRSAFSVYSPVISGDTVDHLTAEARWLGRIVGAQRDLDVITDQLLCGEAKTFPLETGFQTLETALQTRRQDHRKKLRRALSARRAQSFLLGLGKFIETSGWIEARRSGKVLGPHSDLPDLARQALYDQWKKTCARARGIDRQDTKARHALRKELKGLRYGVEFLSPVFPARKVRPFSEKLETLQDVFGSLNDLATAEAFLTGPEAPARDDPAAQRAVGLILGTRSAQATRDWREARAHWKDLVSSGIFWD